LPFVVYGENGMTSGRVPAFLPIDRNELQARGWDRPDIIIVTGDAYVDHPSFGAAIIGRYLEAEGYKVGIIAQPRNDDDWQIIGKPRLFWGVTSGNMDSMVNHYTAQRKLRHDDAYSPGGKSGCRPDRTVLIYCNHIRRLDKDAVIVIGGIEASLRRIAHYDYWSDSVRKSILADAKADILVYGMGERAIREIASALDDRQQVSSIRDVKGTVVFSREANECEGWILPDSDRCVDKAVFRQMTLEFNRYQATKTIYQRNGSRWIRHNPPAEPLTQNELDQIYGLEYAHAPHPVYQDQTIPAYIQIRDSVTSHRGCYGGCRFCTLSLHQGRHIQSRSAESLVNEIDRMTRRQDFKGTVSDIGGPTANMYGSSCRMGFPPDCQRSSCLYPAVCGNLEYPHEKQIDLLQRVRKIKGIKHVFIASGIRHDMALKSREYIRGLALYHSGGRIKLAPEHSSDRVLKLMNKPPFEQYVRFVKEFEKCCRQARQQKQVIPYLIVGYPGTRMEDAYELGKWLHDNDIRIEQVQEFTPTPMTVATCMYYSELEYDTGEPIEVPKGRQIRLQKAFVFWYDPAWRKYIREAMRTLVGRAEFWS